MKRGTSLLEFIFGLVIMSLMLRASFNELSNTFISLNNLKRTARELLSYAEVFSILQNDIRKLNSTRVSLPIRIAKTPLRFMDESMIEVGSQLKESQWWGLVSPASSLLRIKDKQIIGSHIKGLICNNELKKFLEPFYEAIGVFENSESEVRINILDHFYNTIDKSECVHVEVINSKQLISTSPNYPLPFLVGILIINEKFIYFIDEKHQLRRIQIASDRVIENQPILSTAPRMKLSQKADIAGYDLEGPFGLQLPLYRQTIAIKTPLITSYFLSSLQGQ